MAGELDSRKSLPERCSQCDGEMMSPAVCSQCHALYPVDDVNYFDLLDLEATYDVDPAAVLEHYLNLARAVHPDRLGANTPEVEHLSLRTTAQINQARTVLLDPVLRAAYMLEIAGGAAAPRGRAVPQEVLMDTLELREQIEEAQAENDQKAMAKCAGAIRAKYDGTLKRISNLARTLPGDDVTRAALRAELDTVSYYKKLLEQIA